MTEGRIDESRRTKEGAHRAVLDPKTGDGCADRR
jgi:hypothetical protein